MCSLRNLIGIGCFTHAFCLTWWFLGTLADGWDAFIVLCCLIAALVRMSASRKKKIFPAAAEFYFIYLLKFQIFIGDEIIDARQEHGHLSVASEVSVFFCVCCLRAQQHYQLPHTHTQGCSLSMQSVSHPLYAGWRIEVPLLPSVFGHLTLSSCSVYVRGIDFTLLS